MNGQLETMHLEPRYILLLFTFFLLFWFYFTVTMDREMTRNPIATQHSER
jgi:hypothetical protein